MNRRSARNRHRRMSQRACRIIGYAWQPNNDRPLVRIRYEDGTEDVAELHTEHPMMTGIVRIDR